MTTPTTQTGTPPPATNGATTQTQQPAPAVQTPSEAQALKAQLAEAEKREVQLKRELVVGRQQAAREREQQKLSFGEKLKAADEYERLRKTATVDKLSAAKALLGENFLEELNQQAANGGAPTAASLQNALERVREDTLREVDARTQKLEQAQQERETKAEKTARAHLTDETAFFYEQVAAEFPIFEALGDAKRVGEVLASHINGPVFTRFRQALASGDADTRAAIYRQVASNVETMMLGIADKAVSHEKYQPKFREKLTPAQKSGVVPPSSQSLPPSQSSQSQLPQGRRSLNNDIATGNTPPLEEPKRETDDERRRRLVEKYAPTVLKRS